jgi:hypothetical protein
MPDVRVAIGTDTAVGGPINVNETGPRNGWLVQALARAYTGGTWSSASGGGTYEYFAFRRAGVQGLELEDNYAFRAQHTALDRPEIVSVQQLGEQVVAVTRELGSRRDGVERDRRLLAGRTLVSGAARRDGRRNHHRGPSNTAHSNPGGDAD